MSYLVKMVRDGIPMALGEPATLTYTVLSFDARRRALRRKLGEEALEYIDEPSMGELADVYAVVEALAKLEFGQSISDVAAMARRKAEACGGFERGLGMFAQHPRDGQGRLDGNGARASS